MHGASRIASLAVARTSAMALDQRKMVAITAFTAYVFVAWVGSYVLQTYNNDGIARIAKAYAALFGRDPHLGAVGFVWPPLPVLSDLPLVAVLKPLGLLLLAGPIMSSVYAAFAILQLWIALEKFELPVAWRVVWIVPFGAHPLIVQNATMGLSEAPFLAFLLLSLNGYLSWERGNKTSGLVLSGVGAALALYCRYEALAWIAVVAFCVLVRQRAQRRPASTAIGSLIAFTTPPIWALVIWMLINWQMMGNPLYFLVGQGSTATTPDTAQAVGRTHPYAIAYGSLVGALLLLLRQIVELAPLTAVATGIVLCLSFWRRHFGAIGHLAIAWSVLGFVYVIAYRGLLPPFSRYFFWVVPAGVITAGAAYATLRPGWPRQALAAASAALLLLPSVWLPLAAWSRLYDPVPQRLIGAILLPPEVADARQVRGQLDEFKAIAAYLNAQLPGKVTLVDGAVAEAVLLFVDRPREIAMTSDRDFAEALRAPVGRVDQMLVPFPSFDARGRSDILRAYPRMYDVPEPWARLVREFAGPSAFRLYEVVHQ